MAYAGRYLSVISPADKEAEQSFESEMTQWRGAGSRSDSELHALYRDIFNALVRTKRGSPERRNYLASLDNIEIEIASRAPRP